MGTETNEEPAAVNSSMWATTVIVRNDCIQISESGNKIFR